MNVALKGTLIFPSSIVVVAITSVCGGKEHGILVVMRIKSIIIALSIRPMRSVCYDRVSDVVENGVSFASKILTHNRMH